MDPAACSGNHALIVPSEFCRQVFGEKLDMPIEVVPLGVNPVHFPELDRPERDEFTFLMVGTLSGRKGADIAVDAFESEFAPGEPVRLLLKTMAGVLELGSQRSEPSDPRIEVIDSNISRSELLRLYGSADCLVSCSRGEASGLTPREAMSTGIPAIVTKWGDCWRSPIPTTRLCSRSRASSRRSARSTRRSHMGAAPWAGWPRQASTTFACSCARPTRTPNGLGIWDGTPRSGSGRSGVTSAVLSAGSRRSPVSWRRPRTAMARFTERLSAGLARLAHAGEQLNRLEHYGAHIAGQNDRAATGLDRLEHHSAQTAAALQALDGRLALLEQQVGSRLVGRHVGVLPLELVAALQRRLGIRRAVETGTSKGSGTALLAGVFEHVTTIELSEREHQLAVRRFAGDDRVTLLHGDSRELLPRTVHADSPTLYWLDGHWMGIDVGAEGHPQCPLMDELEALRDGHPDDCILIDDARFFIASPPPPFDSGQWPTLVEVMDALREIRPQSHVTVCNDVVVAVPQPAKAIVDAFAHARLGSFEELPLPAPPLDSSQPPKVQPRIVGPVERLHVAETANVFDALLDVNSGSITIDDWAFLGHQVMVLTGGHDYSLHGLDRQLGAIRHGRDIHIGRGAWLASRSMVLGPCTIGESAVVAAGAVVTKDVPPFTVVAGVPARPTGEVPRPG